MAKIWVRGAFLCALLQKQAKIIHQKLKIQKEGTTKFVVPFLLVNNMWQFCKRCHANAVQRILGKLHGKSGAKLFLFPLRQLLLFAVPFQLAVRQLLPQVPAMLQQVVQLPLAARQLAFPRLYFPVCICL